MRWTDPMTIQSESMDARRVNVYLFSPGLRAAGEFARCQNLRTRRACKLAETRVPCPAELLTHNKTII